MEIKLSRFNVKFYGYVTRKADRDYKRAIMDAIDIDQHKILDMSLDANVDEAEFLKKSKMRINLSAHEAARDKLILGLVREVKTKKNIPVTADQDWLDTLSVDDFETLHKAALDLKLKGEDAAKKS